jgi:hypothetical protein
MSDFSAVPGHVAAGSIACASLWWWKSGKIFDDSEQDRLTRPSSGLTTTEQDTAAAKSTVINQEEAAAGSAIVEQKAAAADPAIVRQEEAVVEQQASTAEQRTASTE